MVDIIGLGSAFVDYFFEVDSEFLKKHSLLPEDDKLFDQTNLTFHSLSSEVKYLERSPGSIAINTLAVLSHLGASSTYIGVIGKDENGDYLINSRKDINFRHSLRKGQMSVCACLLSNGGKSRAFLSQMNKCDNEIFKNLVPKKLNQSKFVFLSNYMLNVDKVLDPLEKILSQLNSGKLIFTMSTFYAYFGLEKMKPLFRNTYCLFINQTEVDILTKKDAKKGSRELLKLGPQIVVCTMGSKGVWVTTKDSQFFSPASKVKKIKDSTGAGDTFAGAFIYGLLKNKSLRWSAEFANKTAAKALSDFGLHWLKSF